ncbi:MAG: hypothetical protein PHT12_01410, partial [Patescibacteria group bacterium]|nr:hypothetical protein [Patescibacteria group bacterium]
MEEEQQKTVLATDWRGYVKELFQTVHSYRRVWRVLVGPGLGRLVATFCLAALAASACAMATPIAIAAMF